jgi:hypothetical protein
MLWQQISSTTFIWKNLQNMGGRVDIDKRVKSTGFRGNAKTPSSFVKAWLHRLQKLSCFEGARLEVVLKEP